MNHLNTKKRTTKLKLINTKRIEMVNNQTLKKTLKNIKTLLIKIQTKKKNKKKQKRVRKKI